MSTKQVGRRSRSPATLVLAASLILIGVMVMIRAVELPSWRDGIEGPIDRAMTQEELDRYLSHGGTLALPPSTAQRVIVESISVDAPVDSVGLDREGNIGAPPLFRADRTAWFTESSYPGAQGISVIVGHVDSRRTGPAVFYELGGIELGDEIKVQRKDRTTAVFTVTEIAGYSKSAFPYETVFAATAAAEIRLITCSGPFDRASGNYLENTVVYGILTDVAL